MLKKLRIIFALIFFSLITLLFLDFTGTLQSYLGWMAKIQFFPTLLSMNLLIVFILILLTFLWGRVYCSVICPLGIMQDFFAWLGKKQKKNRYSFSPEKKILRRVILAIFVVLILVPGCAFVALLIEPYSIYGRIASSILAPIYALCNNFLASFSERLGSYAFYNHDVWIKSLSTLIISFLFLMSLAYLSWKNGRTWCNTICPVGTILGFVSKYSIFKIAIDSSRCNSCGMCARNCKSSCIDSKEHHVDGSRCVACMDCIDKCKKGAIQYKLVRPIKEEKESSVDVSRRQFLSVGTMMVAGATLDAQAKKLDGGLAKLQDKEIPERKIPLKPAGALSISNFSNHCTACQLCVSSCPNDVLRPSSDLKHLMQPGMSFEKGYCRSECNHCSQVCPAGAIKPISIEEKSSIQIGHAVWRASNCIVETDKVQCNGCLNHCPVGAIQQIAKDPNDPNGLKIPVVDESRCIGCGACENLCPARPFSAIYVEGYEVHHSF